MTPEIEEIKTRLFDGIIEYRDDCPGCYSDKSISNLREIINLFLKDMEEIKISGEIKKIIQSIKVAVISINNVGEIDEDPLVETEQREDICEIISLGATFAGDTSGEDLTEEWREW